MKLRRAVQVGGVNMTFWDLQKKSGEEIKALVSKMSKAEVKTVIDSCGTAQGKAYIKRLWQNLTGEKY